MPLHRGDGFNQTSGIFLRVEDFEGQSDGIPTHPTLDHGPESGQAFSGTIATVHPDHSAILPEITAPQNGG